MVRLNGALGLKGFFYIVPMRKGLILLVATALFACKTKKEVASSAEKIETTQSTESHVEPASADPKVIHTQDSLGTGSAYHIDKAVIVGDSLLLTVSYSGGCAPHDFVLWHSGKYLKSKPPQLKLTLKHENNRDNCRSRISEVRKFSLLTLRYDGQPSIQIHLNRFPEPILYQYHD